MVRMRSVTSGGAGLLFKNQNQVATDEVTSCNLMSSFRYDDCR